MKITFLGAAGEVTGSQHLIETDTLRILLDCGLFQGPESEVRPKNQRFLCQPRALDAVILSHAHIDHCGNLPGLIRAGYKGPIYCTRATGEIAALMMRDSARIQEEDARYYARKNLRWGDRPAEPLYTEEDARVAAKRFEYVRFGHWEKPSSDLRFRFRHAGHILGSAITELEIKDGDDWKRIVFTGDLGRRNLPLLEDPETVGRCDALICESTYADRIHPDTDNVKERLADIICEASRRNGKVIIPAFSLGRTQMLVYLLNELRNENALCRVPVFIDSPLATRLTDVYRDHADIMDDDVRQTLLKDDDLFNFEGLTYVRTQDESMALNRRNGPCVIISASGMCESGRIVHHLKHAVSDPANTILIIGFQAENTLGRRIVERQPVLNIFGRQYPLNANVVILNGLSAHADAEDFRWWFGALQKEGGAGQIFLVHGEPKAAAALSELVRDVSDEPPMTPQFGDSVEI